MDLIFGSLTIGGWFLYEYLQNGSWFIEQFITYQIRLLTQPDAGHGGFPLYHFVIVLLGCFPMSWFALQSLWKPKAISTNNIRLDIFRKWMLLLLAVVLILFSIVQSKIVHYSSLSYFPLSFLAAYTLYNYELGSKLKGVVRWGLIINAALLVIASITLPLIAPFAEQLIQQPRNTELMAMLSTVVEWPKWTLAPGIFSLLILVLILFVKDKYRRWKVSTIFIGTAIFIFIGLFAFIGRIEKYTQGPAIEFMKEKSKEGYVLSHGFKSYAPYFYGQVIAPPPEGFNSHAAWLETTKADKPVYLVSRVHKADRLPAQFGFKKIGSKGMFVFFIKEN